MHMDEKLNYRNNIEESRKIVFDASLRGECDRSDSSNKGSSSIHI